MVDIAHGEAQIRISPKKRVTMTDIANDAGCSQSTVSVVLNRTEGIIIAKQTKMRVLEAAKKLGYRHHKSRSRSVNNPRQIAIIFDQLSSSPEAVVSIDGARAAAWASGHVVAAFQTLNDPKMEPLTIAAANAETVDAVIYATIMTREVTLPSALQKMEKPVILLNCYSKCQTFPSILPGEVVGGKTATSLLTAAGHKRIAHITGEMWMDAAKSRLKGYQQALFAADIAFDPDLVREGDWQSGSGYRQTKSLLGLKDRPTAFFCSNDRMAAGCYEAVREAGLSIPKDISIVGYDDEDIARQLSPKLTTLVLPHREMGAWSVQTALKNELDSEGNEKKHYPLAKLECILVERESVAAPSL